LLTFFLYSAQSFYLKGNDEKPVESVHKVYFVFNAVNRKYEMLQDWEISDEQIIPPLSDDDKMVAGMCYPAWFAASPWVLLSDRKNEPFLYFHALQSVFLGAATTILSIISLLLMYLLFFHGSLKSLSNQTPDLQRQMGCGLVSIMVFTVFLLVVMGIFFFQLWLGGKASSGSLFKLPLIGQLSYEFVTKKLSEERMNFLKLQLRVQAQTQPDQISKNQYQLAGIPESPYPGKSRAAADHNMKNKSSLLSHPDEKKSFEAEIPVQETVKQLKTIFSKPPESTENKQQTASENLEASGLQDVAKPVNLFKPRNDATQTVDFPRKPGKPTMPQETKTISNSQQKMMNREAFPGEKKNLKTEQTGTSQKPRQVDNAERNQNSVEPATRDNILELRKQFDERQKNLSGKKESITTNRTSQRQKKHSLF
jgi:uncharacterized membrane protein